MIIVYYWVENIQLMPEVPSTTVMLMTSYKIFHSLQIRFIYITLIRSDNSLAGYLLVHYVVLKISVDIELLLLIDL